MLTFVEVLDVWKRASKGDATITDEDSGLNNKEVSKRLCT